MPPAALLMSPVDLGTNLSSATFFRIPQIFRVATLVMVEKAAQASLTITRYSQMVLSSGLWLLIRLKSFICRAWVDRVLLSSEQFCENPDGSLVPFFTRSAVAFPAVFRSVKSFSSSSTLVFTSFNFFSSSALSFELMPPSALSTCSFRLSYALFVSSILSLPQFSIPFMPSTVKGSPFSAFLSLLFTVTVKSPVLLPATQSIVYPPSAVSATVLTSCVEGPLTVISMLVNCFCLMLSPLNRSDAPGKTAFAESLSVMKPSFATRSSLPSSLVPSPLTPEERDFFGSFFFGVDEAGSFDWSEGPGWAG